MITLSMPQMHHIHAGAETWAEFAVEGARDGLTFLLIPQQIHGHFYPGGPSFRMMLIGADIVTLAVAAGLTYAGIYYGMQALEEPAQTSHLQAHELALGGTIVTTLLLGSLFPGS